MSNPTPPNPPLRLLLAHADPSGQLPPVEALALAQQAQALAEQEGDAAALMVARAWSTVHRFRSGDYAQALDEAASLERQLLQAGQQAERRELLRVQALCANELGRFDLAMEAAQELVRSAEQSAQAGPRLGAAFVLAASLERMGDSWQADRVLAEALADPGCADAPARDQLIAHNARAAMMIGMFHRLRGVTPADEVRAQLLLARQQAEAALSILQGLDDPVYEVTVAGNLGEILSHLGELDSAQELLGRALALAQQRGMKAHAWRISTSMAEWSITKGRPDHARSAMRKLLLEMGADAPQQVTLRARQAAWRACKGLGLHEEALHHFEVAEALERQRTTSQLRAQSQYFVTRSEVERARTDAQRQRNRANELALRAEFDALTGLANRHYLDRRFPELLAEAQAQGHALAAALLDVDHFKSINDNHGHARGDAVLVSLAELLRDSVRGADLLARMGGEEFVIVLPQMSLHRAVDVCQRLCERIRAHRWPGGVPERVTASIGVAAGGCDPAALLKAADEQLYRAKREGRDRVCAAL